MLILRLFLASFALLAGCSRPSSTACGEGLCLPPAQTFETTDAIGPTTTYYTVVYGSRRVLIHEATGFRRYDAPTTPLHLPVDANAAWGIHEGMAFVKIQVPGGEKRFVELYGECYSASDCWLPDFARRLTIKPSS